MSANIGYLFYKCAYREIKNNKQVELDRLSKITDNKTVIDTVFEQDTTPAEIERCCFPYPASQENQGNNIFFFKLKVLYPGIYAGLGYSHGLSTDKGDIKNGFSFDYTTGLPYIPGSSLKGRLRSLFMSVPDDVAEALETDKKCLVRKLEDILFGSRNGTKDHFPGLLVCYDVFPVIEDQPRRLMKRDYITPHNGVFTPPNPINTAAIAPGSEMRFVFSLPEKIEIDGETITVDRISALFKSLLTDWGIGAKTNTGYGNLAEA